MRTKQSLAASAVRERPVLADVALLRCDCARFPQWDWKIVRASLVTLRRVHSSGATCSFARPCGTACRRGGSSLLEALGAVGTSFDSWSCCLSTDMGFAEPVRQVALLEHSRMESVWTCTDLGMGGDM